MKRLNEGRQSRWYVKKKGFGDRELKEKTRAVQKKKMQMVELKKSHAST